MVKHIFLHIGLDKTGTTTIQVACDVARDALAAEGVAYPKSPIFGSHHLDFARQFGFSWTDVSAAPPLLKRAPEYRLPHICNARSLVLSTEHFVYCADGAHVRSLKQWFEHFFPQAKVIVVLFLRNQVDWFISCFSESIKWGIKTNTLDYYKDFFHRVDHHALVSHWASVFGRENLRIIQYESFQGDVLPLFFKIVQLSDVSLALAQQRLPEFVNRAIPDFVLETIRCSKPMLPRTMMYKFLIECVALNPKFQCYRSNSAEIWPLPPKFLTDLERLNKSNALLANDFPLIGEPIADLRPIAARHQQRLVPVDQAARSTLEEALRNAARDFADGADTNDDTEQSLDNR